MNLANFPDWHRFILSVLIDDYVKITPDLIPHHQFHEGSWLLPVKRPYWYYFRKGKNENHISNKKFLQSVDGPLKELVKYLHNKRIKTTPSCAGHNFSKKNLEKIYNSLKEDKKDICSKGLRLKDCETGKIYVYKNRNYRLPWSKKIFLNKLIIYQRTGVIGIRLRNKNLKEKILQLNIPKVKILEKDSVLLLLTKNTNGNNFKKWEKITKKVKNVFKPFL